MTPSAAPGAPDILLVFTTAPDTAVAERLAERLVAENLAACVNRLPSVHSTYRWKGEICHDSEYLLIIKTRRDCFDAVKTRILELHPYELPEVVVVEVADGHLPYLDWIHNQCAPRD